MTTSTLKGYARLISEATGVTDPARLQQIEDTMRTDIFHSTLDWQSGAVFRRGARDAQALLQALGDSRSVRPV